MTTGRGVCPAPATARRLPRLPLSVSRRGHDLTVQFHNLFARWLERRGQAWRPLVARVVETLVDGVVGETADLSMRLRTRLKVQTFGPSRCRPSPMAGSRRIGQDAMRWAVQAARGDPWHCRRPRLCGPPVFECFCGLGPCRALQGPGASRRGTAESTAVARSPRPLPGRTLRCEIHTCRHKGVLLVQGVFFFPRVDRVGPGSDGRTGGMAWHGTAWGSGRGADLSWRGGARPRRETTAPTDEPWSWCLRGTARRSRRDLAGRRLDLTPLFFWC